MQTDQGTQVEGNREKTNPNQNKTVHRPTCDTGLPHNKLIISNVNYTIAS